MEEQIYSLEIFTSNWSYTYYDLSKEQLDGIVSNIIVGQGVIHRETEYNTQSFVLARHVERYRITEVRRSVWK